MTLSGWALGAAALIELLAAGVIVFYAGRALLSLGTRRSIDAARFLVADGVLAALGFSLAASLLRMLGLQEWAQIRTFATVLVLRTLLKRVFQGERAQGERRARTRASA